MLTMGYCGGFRKFEGFGGILDDSTIKKVDMS